MNFQFFIVFAIGALCYVNTLHFVSLFDVWDRDTIVCNPALLHKKRTKLEGLRG